MTYNVLMGTLHHSHWLTHANLLHCTKYSNWQPICGQYAARLD